MGCTGGVAIATGARPAPPPPDADGTVHSDCDEEDGDELLGKKRRLQKKNVKWNRHLIF